MNAFKKKEERNQGNLFFLCIAKMYLSKFHCKNRMQCCPARNDKNNDNQINGFVCNVAAKLNVTFFYDLLEQRVKNKNMNE